MNTYSVFKSDEHIDWEVIPTIVLENDPWHDDIGYRMYGQVAWNESGLYVHQWCKEDFIRAEIFESNKMVSDDSVMEFFIMPGYEDRYINIEVNPNGRFIFGFCRKRNDWIRLIAMTGEDYLTAKTNYTENGWEVEYSIPIELFRLLYKADFAFKSGQSYRANMFKGGGLSETPHNLVWNPIDASKHDYHLSGDFGEMILA